MPSLTPRTSPPVQSPTPARGHASIPGRDTFAQSLVGEYLTVKKEEREAEERKKRPPRAWRRFASIGAIAACGIVWLLPSLGTRPTPVVSAARQDAGARLTLYLASRRVRDFETRMGRLPTTAAESGLTDSRIVYHLTGKDSFILSLSDAGERWELPSTLADTAYFHDAMRKLGAAPK